jgi:hypothetical protein
MQFPENWTTLHRESARPPMGGAKKRKTAPQPEPTMMSMASFPRNAQAEIPEDIAELQLHTLISRLPFNEMLGQMMVDGSKGAADVPIVTKAYEESYMREPLHADEEPCVCGEQCEARFIDPDQPFVATQFVLGRGAGDAPAMCVLCTRRVTQELFYDLVYGGKEMTGLIQRYGVVCGPNEYAKEALLLCPPNGPVHNHPLPSVAHHRHKYVVVVQNGFRYLRQHNVAFEDFR